jgi:hypothetical protein
MNSELFVLARKSHLRAEYVTHVSGFDHTRGAQVSFTKLVSHAKVMSLFYAELHVGFLAKHYGVDVEMVPIPKDAFPSKRLRVERERNVYRI